MIKVFGNFVVLHPINTSAHTYGGARIMIIDDVFDFLKAMERTSTHAHFSLEYLGHGERYYDYLRSSGAEPSMCSLLKLALNLTRIAREGLGNPSSNEAGIAARLSKRVWDEVIDRCQ